MTCLLTDKIYRRGPLVGKLIWMAAAVGATVLCLCADALADGVVVKRHAHKVSVHPHTCIQGCIVRRPVCPDPYSCYSLYGAYGPYGGRAYWTRYTRAGWYR